MSGVNWCAVRGHTLVLLSTLAGIVGMGMVFEGVMHGSAVGVSQGLPVLLIGLWWAGRELGRSMIASRRKRFAHSTAQNEGRG